MSDRHEHTISHMPTSGTGIAVCECGATMRVVMGKPTEPWHGCPLCCITYDGAMPGTPDVIKHHFCLPKMELLTMDEERLFHDNEEGGVWNCWCPEIHARLDRLRKGIA